MNDVNYETMSTICGEIKRRITTLLSYIKIYQSLSNYQIIKLYYSTFSFSRSITHYKN